MKFILNGGCLPLPWGGLDSPPLHPSSPCGLRRDSGRGELDRFQKRLDAARPAIRRELAARMNQKYVPDIGFTYDDTLEKSARIDALLANIEKE